MTEAADIPCGDPVAPSVGTLYGLGVGPGDPDLITLKAWKIMRAVPVLAYPAPLEGDSLARSIAAPHLEDGQGTGRTEIAIRMPFQEDRFAAEEAYDRAVEEMSRHLAAGRDVAVLCLGDPFLYGTFMHLFARISGRFPVEIVPGVSAITAASAASGMPLATRDDVFTVIPGTLGEEAIAARLENTDAAAIIKIGRHFRKIHDLLARLGLSETARYVERASMTGQRILPLDAVGEDDASYFSIILVQRRGKAWS